MIFGNSDKPNASGLTPDQTRALPSAPSMPSAPRRGLPRPVGIARGLDSIRAQFDALPKLFPRADIQKFRVLENPPGTPASLLLVDQDSASPFKVVNSLLTLELDDAHQVTRHTEEWNHQRETTADDGFLGMLNEQRKRLTASLTDAYMSKSK
ncbi:hypothetical protein BC834DRAFT_921277 [Gloeopeniophorella convolvens]|nr:hypothetical protein BC834DRAFT_921277 [Gloeopeniophorella convolvens]